jgi:ferric enterobactin receptor
MNKAFVQLFLLILPLIGFSQNVSVSGKVISSNGEPIFFAVVNIKGTTIFSNTDDNGAFKLFVPTGKRIIAVSMLGYAPFEQELAISKPLSNLIFTLKESSLQLDGVVVTAKSSQSKEGTSTYSIGNDAIKQVQATSLTDIVSLLPGGKLAPQKLTNTAQLDLRTAENSEVNSFGTSIIIDGTPLSNDANLQSSNPSAGLSGGTNVANKGVDLREIPASNIESVEVVTGVASAKYGNITSGAVIVTRKAGYSPLNINFNSTPSSYQGSISRGFKLKRLGYINMDADYAYSINRPTEKRDFYQRINVGTRWTTTVNKPLSWSNTLALSYGFNGDGRRTEPDEVLVSNRDIKNHRLVISNNGRLDLLGNLSYTFSVNATSQYTKLEMEETDGPRPLVEPMETGTYFTTFSPLSYIQTTVMKGLPINIYSRIESDQNKTIAGHNINFTTGIEYSIDKNFGEGRIQGGESVGAAGVPGSRGAKFHDIPASKTFSAYHQVSIARELTNFMYQFKAGLRYDNMIERFNLLSPRISGMIGLFKQLKIRGAWGLAYKAPSMITLYSGPIYFDLVNLSYYDPIPAERLAVVTSTVITPDNHNLKPSKGETREVSAEWGSGGFNLKVTGYQKTISNGITSTSNLMVLKNQGYRIVSEPVGAPPVVEPDPAVVSYAPRIYSSYVNNASAKTNGLEFTISTPAIKDFKTSVSINGQFIKTESFDDVPAVRFSNGYANKSRYGVYQNNLRYSEMYNANITVIQPLTKLRMMVTITTELNIYANNYQENVSLLPVAYYDDKGTYIAIAEADRAKTEYADLILSSNQFTPNMLPFYPNFHLQVRKETRQGHSFSFYANNCLWYNPYHTDPYSQGTSQLNGRISFGFGVGIKL